MTRRPAKAETSAGRRVLLLSHSHPKLTRGGAEMAAVALQAGLNAQPGWQAFLVGATMDPGGARDGSPITQPFGDDDYLYTVGAFGWFNFANRDRNFPRAFAECWRKCALMCCISIITLASALIRSIWCGGNCRMPRSF